MIDPSKPHPLLYFPASSLESAPPGDSAQCESIVLADSWPPLLVPMLTPDDEPTPEIERALATAARAAQAGDRAARDALVTALAGKIERIAAREAWRAARAGGLWRDGRPWDREDLAQEAVCILIALIDEWPGDRPFLTYVLAYLPWRLRDARRRLMAPSRFETHPVDGRDQLVADGSAGAERARARVEAIAAGLPPIERALLLGIVRDGERRSTIAGRLGIDRRTANRRWEALRAELRCALTPDGAV